MRRLHPAVNGGNPAEPARGEVVGTDIGTGPVGAGVVAATGAVVVAGLLDGTVGGNARWGRPATSDARPINVPVNATTRTAPTASPTDLAVLTATPPLPAAAVCSPGSPVPYGVQFSLLCVGWNRQHVVRL
jgi:hypothetical protein